MKIKIRKKDLQKRFIPGRTDDPDPAAAEARQSLTDEAAGDGKYFSLFQNFYYAVLIVGVEGEVSDANRRAEKFFGANKSSLVGLQVADLVYGMDERMMKKVAENIARGRYTVLNGTCIRRGGSKFAAEIALSGIEEAGSRMVVFSIRNHSRIDGVQSQLRTEHNALQNAASAIVVADADGKFQFVNKAFIDMWKFPNSEAGMSVEIGRLWMDPRDARDLMEKPDSDSEWSGELLAVKRDGTPFWVQAMSAPNRDETGQVVGKVFSFIDVSERYEAEESIRRELEGQMDQAKERDHFSGLLNIIRIEDVFQLIDSAKKSGELLIRDESECLLGRVRFSEGNVASADAGELRDKPAIVDLLRRSGHSFEFKSGAGVEHPVTMNESTTSILLQSSRIIDEDR